MNKMTEPSATKKAECSTFGIIEKADGSALPYIKIEEKDAVVGLSEIPSESIDLIFTDPPYPREYNYLYEVLAKEAKRILKPGAYCFVYCGADSLPNLIELMNPHLTWFWLFEIKHNGGYPRVWNKKLMVGSKPVLAWTKGKPRRREWLHTFHSTENGADKKFHKWGQSTGFATKIIETLTEEGELVVDPFLGGGTTAKVCKELNRRFVGFDVDSKCLEVTANRLIQTTSQKTVRQR
jgi:DNA modification methylase